MLRSGTVADTGPPARQAAAPSAGLVVLGAGGK
jgi:hypothetical protein